MSDVFNQHGCNAITAFVVDSGVLGCRTVPIGLWLHQGSGPRCSHGARHRRTLVHERAPPYGDHRIEPTVSNVRRLPCGADALSHMQWVSTADQGTPTADKNGASNAG